MSAIKNSPVKNYSTHINGENEESQFNPTFTSSSLRQHPSHLVVNNFLTSSGSTKSVLTVLHQQDGNSGTGGTGNTHSNFLYVYFFFSYYLCLTPFRLEKVGPSAQSPTFTFVIHEFLPQKIICAAANLLALIRYGVEFRRCVQDVKRDNPISFFKLFEACSGLVFKTVILKCFWINKQKFLDVVNFLDNPYILPYKKFKIESVSVISCLCTFYVMIGFIRMITGDGFLHLSDLSPSWWAMRLVAEARYSFFLANDSQIDEAPLPNDISSLDIVLAVITGLAFQCRFIAGYFVDVGIFLCVLTLWAPVTGFSMNIYKQLKAFENGLEGNHFDDNDSPQSQSTHQPQTNQLATQEAEAHRQETVMMQYKALKRLTELISRACGETILPFISEAVFGYALFFEDVLITANVIHRIVLICFYFCAVNILIFSADVCRKMQCMKAWLWNEERFSSFPNQKLMLVLHDLSTNVVGITASGIFTVDFYLVGSMISVLITLFIIRLQYQTSTDA